MKEYKNVFEWYEDHDDESFEKLFNPQFKDGLVNKSVRFGVLEGYIELYLKNNTIKDLAKLLVDCIPTGYIARLIRILRQKCKN